MTKEKFQIEEEIFDLEIEKTQLEYRMKQQQKIMEMLEKQDVRSGYMRARYDVASEQYCSLIKQIANIIDEINRAKRQSNDK